MLSCQGGRARSQRQIDVEALVKVCPPPLPRWQWSQHNGHLICCLSLHRIQSSAALRQPLCSKYNYPAAAQRSSPVQIRADSLCNIFVERLSWIWRWGGRGRVEKGGASDTVCLRNTRKENNMLLTSSSSFLAAGGYEL